MFPGLTTWNGRRGKLIDVGSSPTMKAPLSELLQEGVSKLDEHYLRGNMKRLMQCLRLCSACVTECESMEGKWSSELDAIRLS
jgi:hypothetical protein